MWAALIPAAISAAGALFGGKKQREAAAEQNQQNYEHQKEFAQMGIRWKAEDAKAAGLHPLAAIGAGGASYTPSSIVAGDSGYAAAGNAVGNALADMGQNTNRAQVATMTDNERQAQELALERARLQNRLLEAQITAEWANVMGQPKNPPMPSAVAPLVPPVGAVEVQPSKVTSRDKKDPSIEAGKGPGYTRVQISDNQWVDVPNQQLAEGIEALPPGSSTAIAVRRLYDRYVNGYEKPPDKGLKAGQRWEWNPWRQSWQVKGGYPDTAGRRVGRPDNVWNHR